MTRTPYPQPFFRKLKGYAFDPSFSSTLSKRQSNEVVYKIKWEPTTPGPCGEYVEVIDYDPTKKAFYWPLSLEEPFVLADHGMALSEGDPRFHQQQVYAVIMSVISQFEKALGRKIIWSKITTSIFYKNDKKRFSYSHDFIPKLRVYPHAMRQQNAYYSPEKNALLFGYFQASSSWEGNNVPGATIFTCLSPDIVAHETTHAILHSIHPYLTGDTNMDMLAFHEGFADILALLQRFTFRTVVEDQIRNSRGDLLSPENMLGDLAIQFGQAVSGNRRALRSFLVEKDASGKWQAVKPDPSLLHRTTEPHTRGGILVAAVFDAFVRLYKFRVADLIRLASNGSGILAQGEIDPDLVRRLSKEACEIADKLSQICIRALDYCPPADLTFGDYLRALVTADLRYNPDDEEGLRFAIMESFRSWGIIPDEVNTFSAESLQWKSPSDGFFDQNKMKVLKDIIKYSFDPGYQDSALEGLTVQRESSKQTKSPNPDIQPVLGSIERILRENDREAIFNESQNLSRIVHHIFKEKINSKNKNTESILGMNFGAVKYTQKAEDGKKVDLHLTAEQRNVFQVYKCRPVIVPDGHTGNTSKLMIIMFLQKVTVDLTGSRYQGYFPDDEYAFRGGASIIVDMANYEIKHVIIKNVGSTRRLIRQLDYAIENQQHGNDSALLMQGSEPFAALHLH
jgi:hypothetical protein